MCVKVNGVAAVRRAVDEQGSGQMSGAHTLPTRTRAHAGVARRSRRSWHAAWNTRIGAVSPYGCSVPRSPLALAALASVAVPGLDVYDVLRSPHSDADFDVVIVKDATGKRWVVRAPKRAAAGAALEAERGLLLALGRAHERASSSSMCPARWAPRR